MTHTNRESKTCVACGRTIEWRKKWKRDGDAVRYCSATCRRRRIRPADIALESAITTLLDASARRTTKCASQAARLGANEQNTDGDDWRDLMEPARAAARRMVAAGNVDIVQLGRVVDPSTAKGPIEIRCRGPR